MINKEPKLKHYIARHHMFIEYAKKYPDRAVHFQKKIEENKQHILEHLLRNEDALKYIESYGL